MPGCWRRPGAPVWSHRQHQGSRQHHDWQWCHGELGGTVTNTVSFEGSTGTLQIDSSGTSSHYSIFGGGALLPIGDEIYLPNIGYDPAADSYNANIGVITASNGTPAGTVTIDVVGGVGSGDTFDFASQGTAR